MLRISFYLPINFLTNRVDNSNLPQLTKTQQLLHAQWCGRRARPRQKSVSNSRNTASWNDTRIPRQNDQTSLAHVSLLSGRRNSPPRHNNNNDNKFFVLLARNETRMPECMALNAYCAICRLLKLRSGEGAAKGRTSTCTTSQLSFPLRSSTGLEVSQYASKATHSGICISFPTDSTHKTAGHDNNSTNSNRVGSTFFSHFSPKPRRCQTGTEGTTKGAREDGRRETNGERGGPGGDPPPPKTGRRT